MTQIIQRESLIALVVFTITMCSTGTFTLSKSYTNNGRHDNSIAVANATTISAKY